MAAKERASAGLVEGHPRFCRACGHDLLGLSGSQCPQCGRAIPPLVSHVPQPRESRESRQLRHEAPAPASGKWLVAGLLAVGLVLAVVGLKYRKVEPRRALPAGGTTRTTTAPADPPATRPAGQSLHSLPVVLPQPRAAGF